MKMGESYPKRKKTLWEKEKFIVMRNFSLHYSVLKRLVLQRHGNKGLFVSGLTTSDTVTFLNAPGKQAF